MLVPPVLGFFIQIGINNQTVGWLLLLDYPITTVDSPDIWQLVDLLFSSITNFPLVIHSVATFQLEYSLVSKLTFGKQEALH